MSRAYVVIQLKKALLKNLSGVNLLVFGANLLVFGRSSSIKINCLSNLYFLWRYIDILSVLPVHVPLILTGVGWSLYFICLTVIFFCFVLSCFHIQGRFVCNNL